MSAGTIVVYARDGLGSSSTGSNGLDGAPDFGHTFVTILDHERRIQIDVDVWRDVDSSEMVVNERVSDKRRADHDFIAFDVDRKALDAALDAAIDFHRRSDEYEILGWNCTDVTEAVLKASDVDIGDQIFPAQVLDALRQEADAGRLLNVADSSAAQDMTYGQFTDYDRYDPPSSGDNPDDEDYEDDEDDEDGEDDEDYEDDED